MLKLRYLPPLCMLLHPVALPAVEPQTDTPPDYPQQQSADDLLTACASSRLTGPGRQRRNYCAGFVSGVEEALRLQGQQHGEKPAVCPPPGLTARQLADTYSRYAAAHRDELRQPAAAVVLKALREAYPCDQAR